MWFSFIGVKNFSTKIKVCYYYFSTQLKDTKNTERELIRLECEIILDHGKFPTKGRVLFDLYEFLLENTPVCDGNVYASMSSNTRAFEDRIERERKC
jgi:hypothetical protein